MTLHPECIPAPCWSTLLSCSKGNVADFVKFYFSVNIVHATTEVVNKIVIFRKLTVQHSVVIKVRKWLHPVVAWSIGE